MSLAHPFERAGPTPIGTLKIGKTSTHQSHKLRIYKGLIFCKNCGSYTQGQLLKSLSQPCEEGRAHGRSAKKRIYEGNKPYGLKQWPAENPTSLFYSIEILPTKGLVQLDLERQIQEIVQATPPLTNPDPSSSPAAPTLILSAASFRTLCPNCNLTRR